MTILNIELMNPLKLNQHQNRTTINFSKIGHLKIYYENEYDNKYENEEKEIMVINDNIANFTIGLFGLNYGC